MPSFFEYNFQAEGHSIKTKFSTGLFINGKFVNGSNNTTIDVINPTTGKLINKVSEGTEKDVDRAVQAAQKAYDTTWGLNVCGVQRGKILIRIAELIERDIDEIAAVEALDNGKAFTIAKGFDASEAAACFRYYGGWATSTTESCWTDHSMELPAADVCMEACTSLATGNTIIIKPSEFTPLSLFVSLRCSKRLVFQPALSMSLTDMAKLSARLSSHMKIEKVAFTGSTAVGRTIMKAAAASNLKNVTLELGGKSPNIIFNDATSRPPFVGLRLVYFFNHGQCCCAGSRVFVQSGVYNRFVELFTAHVQKLKVGDPFKSETFQGPQVSQIQFDRIMGYIESGKSQGATVAIGGERIGSEGYFIQPTVFTDRSKFEDEADIIRQANDSIYGLAAAVFSRDISRALDVAHKLHAAQWFKQSGIGRELGEYALSNYTNIKAVHVNLTEPPP
ncbi:Aldehyde dehydrogenase [Rhizoctonia solani]|uniref:Aldehyde dehydrogenase n=1 Tax=Rhizoctonia solani TaxID=456999 RepID=A0A8H7M6F4_9AGAM|nr:Aldehyde dehydrogenase [Rhizoctonia solani]